MSKKGLSERKIETIRIIVEEYLKDPRPVSSGEIQKKYFKDLCSATIRSEMSSLEDLGYLVQPHTSSGRVPTALAYKFYVENYVNKQPLHIRDKQLIENAFKVGFNKIEDIVKATAKVISDITNYTSVIVIKNYGDILIREIKLVPIDKDSLLVIIITDSGVLKDNIIKLNTPTEDGYVQDATLILNRIFTNLRLKNLENTPLLMNKELEQFAEIIQTVIEMISSYKADLEDSVYIEGETKVLDYPDATLENARHLLSVIDNKKDLIDVLGDVNDIEFSVKIGKDETGIVDNCAVIAAKLLVDGQEVGKAGVIGPKRMDYERVISVLSYIGDTLDKLE